MCGCLDSSCDILSIACWWKRGLGYLRTALFFLLVSISEGTLQSVVLCPKGGGDGLSGGLEGCGKDAA